MAIQPKKRTEQAPRAAAVYVRISDDREGRALGVARQEQDCRALAKKRGWVIAGVYVDNDQSAYSGKPRPRYRDLLEDIKAGTIDGILAWHPDRLHRSPLELEGFIDTIEAAAIPVLTVQGGEYDLSNASGRMTARVVGAVARHESEHKSERIRRKHEELAKAGRIPGGGDRPFGYDDDRMTIRPAEAKLVRDGARRVLAGQSIKSVVRRWNTTGVKTSTGRTWYPSAVRVVLNSPRIAGLREYEGELYPSVWPAIIDRAEWEQLRALFTDPGRRTNRTARKHLLTGFLTCAPCGAKLVARPRTAECVRWTDSRRDLSTRRAHLAALRKRIREKVEELEAKTSRAGERELAAMRRQEGQLKVRIQALENEERHVPIAQRDASRAGSSERRCMTCGAAVESTPTYACASGPGFGGCGKIRRLTAPVDELVGELVIHRVDGPELKKALRDHERKASKAGPGAGDMAVLERKLESLAVDHAKGRIGRREWLAARDEIQGQLDALSAGVRREQRTTALGPYRDGRGALATRWPDLSIDERRAIIAVVIDQVKVHGARKGVNRFDPNLIEPIWRI